MICIFLFLLSHKFLHFHLCQFPCQVDPMGFILSFSFFSFEFEVSLFLYFFLPFFFFSFNHIFLACVVKS